MKAEVKEPVASITAYITEDTNMFFLLKNFQMSKDLRVELTAASCTCNCINCCNNVEHETDRFKAIKNNRTTFMCTCTVVLLFLVAETRCASKSRVNAKNWGPQAMMYLKGRCEFKKLTT
ncbi:hypothetical protein EOD39_5514 [Acipenser ruthenus]|uniref:Uncharacterized protein n=1 Tax=Acipenser ruthenus TaxID=7906 RepID=A0A662YZW7_ACIRT|nr:hypothetical protein EOD39_5514 [Acipenser ruthenus]